MIKRLSALCLVSACLFLVYVSSARPVFSEYAKEYTLYLNDASSSAAFVETDRAGYIFYPRINGESVTVPKEGFDVEKFLNDFSAEVIFTEEVEAGISVYAFSPSVRYRKTLENRAVNLHVFIGKDAVSLGSPVIFGSF